LTRPFAHCILGTAAKTGSLMPMSNTNASARRLIRRLTPILGLLLLAVLFVGGAHRHADGDHHACVVCAVGHSTAISADMAAPPAAPAGASQPIHAPPERAPRPTRLEAAPSRAPPLA
jgi:hypothetical protein